MLTGFRPCPAPGDGHRGTSRTRDAGAVPLARSPATGSVAVTVPTRKASVSDNHYLLRQPDLLRPLDSEIPRDVSWNRRRVAPAWAPGTTYPATAEAVGTARGEVASIAVEAGASKPALADIKLAVGEALSNAVFHAYAASGLRGETFTVSTAADGPLFSVWVTDEGQGGTPDVPSSGLGLGLPLMAKLCQRLEIGVLKDGRSQVELRFDLGCLARNHVAIRLHDPDRSPGDHGCDDAYWLGVRDRSFGGTKQAVAEHDAVEATAASARLIERAPVLARLSDEQLARRCLDRHDRLAADLLVRRYIPLARALARRYAHTSEPAEDLAQVACTALIAALPRFRPERGASLRAFAVPTMLGELRRYFRDAGWSVHVPRSLQERSRAVRQALERLSARQGRPATIGELATETQLASEAVLEALEVAGAYRADSLDAPAPGEEQQERPAAARLGYDDAGFARAEQRVALGRALAVLSARERRIVELRFDAELTQSEIGRALGISQMHVSRLLRRALERMEAVMQPQPGATVYG
jgi:RNA polymerase sigma-B factor